MRGALALGASQGAFVLSGFVVNLGVGRLLGPAPYGRFSVVVSLLTIVNLVQTQGVPQALSRTVAQETAPEPAAWRSALRLQRITSLVGMAVLVGLAPTLAWLLHDGRLLHGLIVAALAVPGYAAFATLWGVLNGRRDYQRQAVLMTSYSATRAVVIVALAATVGFDGAILGFAIAPLVAYALVAGARPKTPPETPRMPLWPLVRFALPSIGLGLAVVATMSVDLLFVKGFAGDAPAGLYAGAQTLSRVPYFVLAPAGVILFPAMAQAVGIADRDRLRRLVEDGLEGAVALVVVLVALVVAARGPLLVLVFGRRFAGAAATLALLGPALGLLALASTLTLIIAGLGRPVLAMLIGVCAVVVQLAAGIALCAAYGSRGAAAGTLVACAVALVVAAASVRRMVGVLARPSRVARLVVCAAGCYPVAALAATPVQAVGLCAAAAVVYGLLMVALRVVPAPLLRRG